MNLNLLICLDVNNSNRNQLFRLMWLLELLYLLLQPQLQTGTNNICFLTTEENYVEMSKLDLVSICFEVFWSLPKHNIIHGYATRTILHIIDKKVMIWWLSDLEDTTSVDRYFESSGVFSNYSYQRWYYQVATSPNAWKEEKKDAKNRPCYIGHILQIANALRNCNEIKPQLSKLLWVSFLHQPLTF